MIFVNRINLAAMLCLAAFLGCEAATTGQWLPDPAGGARGAASRRLGAEVALVEPAPVFLWDKGSGKRLAVAVAAKDNLVWSPGQAGAESRELLFGPSLRESQPLTAPTLTAAGVWLTAEKMLPTHVANPRKLKVGDVLWRVDWDGQIDIRERLEVVGVASAWVLTTCPRTAQGLVFRGDSGEWLPLRWQLDPHGGCPVLAALEEPPQADDE